MLLHSQIMEREGGLWQAHPIGGVGLDVYYGVLFSVSVLRMPTLGRTLPRLRYSLCINCSSIRMMLRCSRSLSSLLLPFHVFPHGSLGIMHCGVRCSLSCAWARELVGAAGADDAAGAVADVAVRFGTAHTHFMFGIPLM